MFVNKQRSPTLIDVYDFSPLHMRAHSTNINTKNYLLSKSSLPPMSYRDLRLVVSKGIPSNLLLLPKTSSSSRTSFTTPKLQKKEQKKPPKQTGFDVYRSLTRSLTHSLTNSERDGINDDMSLITNSVTIDRISPLSSTGLFRTQNLPKIQKHQNLNNKRKSICEQSEYMRSSTPEVLHRTTPTSQYCEEKNDKITPTTKVSSYMPKNQTRKQIHVYIPSINC